METSTSATPEPGPSPNVPQSPGEVQPASQPAALYSAAAAGNKMVEEGAAVSTSQV